MKISKTLIMVAAVFTAVFGLAQSANPSAPSSFVGIWEGEKTNGLPSITMKIRSDGAALIGEAVFYFQQRSDSSQSWHAVADTPFPIVSARLQGKVLRFEVPHQTCHGCSKYDPNTTFRMELIGTNQARLWRLDETDMDAGPGIKLSRTQ
jgi:hypothetical protein